MPYKIKKFKTGYKVCKTDNTKCFSNEPIPLKRAKKQLMAIGISESKSKQGGNINNKFLDELNKLGINPHDYLKVVKFWAKKNSYNPDLIEFSNKPNKKLVYNNKIHFGSSINKDFIIYNFLEALNKIELGSAIKKRDQYKKRAFKVMKETKDKLSPASLSYFILW
jgi:hypothetical protein